MGMFMREPKNLLRLLSAALLIWFGLTEAFAAESQKLPFSGEWEGEATHSRGAKYGVEREPLKVEFHVKGNPPALTSISYARGDASKGTASHFEVEGTKIKFWVGPKDESGKGKQVYDLELEDGALKGTLVGPGPTGKPLKRDIVLRPQ
jgi:hypothetical protein